jgi:hypothetical protein
MFLGLDCGLPGQLRWRRVYDSDRDIFYTVESTHFFSHCFSEGEALNAFMATQAHRAGIG